MRESEVRIHCAATRRAGWRLYGFDGRLKHAGAMGRRYLAFGAVVNGTAVAMERGAFMPFRDTA